jgi:hypothetical protein
MAHVHIIGASGSGKSTLAKHRINAAIFRGEGLLFLTPHAEDATDLLDTIPKKRRKHTFLFDPSDFALNWNPLDTDDHDLTATAFVDTIRSLSRMADSATANMDMTVHSCIAALLETGGTLLDIPTLLSDKQFRLKVTDTIKDSAGKEHWAWFESLDKRQQGDITRSTYNKFYQLKADKRLRQVFGFKDTKLDLKDIVLNNDILIARLPNGKLGAQKVKLIGNLLLSLANVAAMSRTDQAPFHIVADECHWWAPDILEELLTGARKFGVSLTCINQFVSQLDPNLLDALRGNAESHVFRLAEDDARHFQKWFPENALTVNIEDLPDFTYRKFPWRKRDKDVTVSPFEPERFPENRAYIEETMKRNYMGG